MSFMYTLPVVLADKLKAEVVNGVIELPMLPLVELSDIDSPVSSKPLACVMAPEPLAVIMVELVPTTLAFNVMLPLLPEARDNLVAVIAPDIEKLPPAVMFNPPVLEMDPVAARVKKGPVGWEKGAIETKLLAVAEPVNATLPPMETL